MQLIHLNYSAYNFYLQKKTLDLRYNEMWQAWNDTASEDNDYSTELFKPDLVLSWKQLNVTVTKKIPKLFGRNEFVNKQILNNGENNNSGTISVLISGRKAYALA